MELAGITQGRGKVGVVVHRRFQKFEFVADDAFGLMCSIVQYDVPAKHDQ